MRRTSSIGRSCPRRSRRRSSARAPPRDPAAESRDRVVRLTRRRSDCRRGQSRSAMFRAARLKPSNRSRRVIVPSIAWSGSTAPCRRCPSLYRGGGRGSFTTGLFASNVRRRGGLECPGPCARRDRGRARSPPRWITDERARLAAFALEMARTEGATYADIRINRYRNQMISFRAQSDRATRKPVEVPGVADSESFGFGIRVLAEGTWGFASSYDVSNEAIARAAAHAVEIAKANASLRRQPVQLAPTPAYKDTYRTADRHRSVLRFRSRRSSICSARSASRGPGGQGGLLGQRVSCCQRSEDRFFASSEGSVIQQMIYQVAPEFTAQAIEAGRKVKSRTYRPNAVCAGYEAVERAKLVENARRVGERGRRALEGTVGLAGRQRPGLAADPPGPDDPRVDRPLDRARSGPRLRGQLRRHQLPHARQAGQVPRRLRDRQLLRRPHPAREPLDLRLRRRRRQDPAVPDHQETASSSASRRSATRPT